MYLHGMRAVTPNQRRSAQGWKATDLAWHQLILPRTAAVTGSSLAFTVFSPYIASPQSFSVDDFSLSSPG